VLVRDDAEEVKLMSNEHDGNAVKAVFNPETGVTSNFIASNPDVDEPDRKNDWSHGHIDVDSDGNVGFRRDPGER
jgi:hypothetical protein